MDTVTTPNAMMTSYDQRVHDHWWICVRNTESSPRFAFPGCQGVLTTCSPEFDPLFHLASVKLRIAFPDLSFLLYDCGKLQGLSRLLGQRKAEGHRSR